MTARKSAHPTPAAAELLGWYDRHRRSLPWRVEAGERPDPYRVWLSEIMLQQTTVAAVKPHFAQFLARFPDIAALAEAPAEAVMQAWAGLGYYSRARNLHACARQVTSALGGRFPESEDGLRALPGIGPYTAAAIAAIAFDRRAAAVDGNVERVMTRLLRLEHPLPAARTLIRERTLELVPPVRPGDFAQALMDLGATVCTPRTPACGRCPWQKRCAAHAQGEEGRFPLKATRPSRSRRSGAAYVALRADGSVLLRTRPPSGLLGGMAEVPGEAWREGDTAPDAPVAAPLVADWRRAPRPIRHVFTHFSLELTVFAARVGAERAAPAGMRFTPLAEIGAEALPNVMRKALAAGLEALGLEAEGLSPSGP